MERRHGGDGVGDGHGLEVCLHRRLAQIALARPRGVICQAAAPPLHQAQEAQEPGPLPNTEQFLDVAGVEAVEPLLIPLGIRRIREQRLGQATVEQAPGQVDLERILALGRENGRQVDDLLAAGE
jgi:hypothetical protein